MKRDRQELSLDDLEAASGGWSLGGYGTFGVSGFGVSRSWTVDTSGNIYRSEGTGPTFPGIGVGAGAFYSTGTPQDHFAGEGISTSVGAGRVGAEVGTSSSGQNLGVSLGLGVSPINSADTQTTQVGTVGDYFGGTPDPGAYDALGNYNPGMASTPDPSPAAPFGGGGINVNDLPTPQNLPDTTPRDLYGMESALGANGGADPAPSYDGGNDAPTYNGDAMPEQSAPEPVGDFEGGGDSQFA